MTDENSKLMSRVELKKRELELAVERAQRNHASAMTDEADAIQGNLDYLKGILSAGVEDLSDEQVKRLEEWLPPA